MANYFCSTCSTLMYRVGSAFPGQSILRIGIVDDFNLHETKWRPRVEQFAKDSVGWLRAVEGVKQVEGSAYTSVSSECLNMGCGILSLRRPGDYSKSSEQHSSIRSPLITQLPMSISVSLQRTVEGIEI